MTVGVVLLETERLVLRRFTAEDVDLLVALDSDPAVTRFVTGGAPTPRDEVEREWLPAFLAAYERGAGYGFFAAEEKPGRAFVGWFHLRPAPDAPRDAPELGYRLARSAWGRGLATEGARALVHHAFADLGARRVVAECMAVHQASRRVMEKAGLRLVREFHADWPVRIDGDEHGDVEYALTRAEWKAAKASGGSLAAAADREAQVVAD
jgi:RimJ/RimL family protein N-acetyltransferase